MHSGKGLALGRQPTQLAFCKTTTPRLKRIPTPGRPVCEFSSARFAVQPTLDAELKEKSREYRRTVRTWANLCLVDFLGLHAGVGCR